MSKSWQEQAVEFMKAIPRVDGSVVGHTFYRLDRAEVLGAVAGGLARIPLWRVMGGPHKSTLDEMYAVFALGCRAFLAAYEAEER